MHRSLLELTAIEMQAVCSTSTATTAHFTTICFKIPIQMGVSALECCAPAGATAQELRGELRPDALAQPDYLRLRTQLRLMNLVTALGEQIRRFEGSSKQVEEISQEFQQISSFLEMIDYEAEHAFLNILHSWSKAGEEGHHELCVVDISSLKAGSPQLQSELKQCFKILSLLQIPQPLPNYHP